MAKRKKLKKWVYYALAIIVIIICGSIYGYNKYQEYLYHQTYEYKLLEHGYEKSEVDTILEKFTDNTDLDYFLNNEKNSNLILLTKEKYYLSKNFYKYIDYMSKNKKMDLETVVRNINIHLDQNYYEGDYESDVSLGTSILVNKYYSLSSEYVPDDIVSISQDYAWGEAGSRKIRQVAYDAFLRMWQEAKNEGYYLMVNSGYRTYEEQEAVYENYKKNQGTKYADGIAAHPGSSEHQTGLALDIFSKANPTRKAFQESEEFNWLKNNAYRFGFILRYPEGKEKLTGFDYEAWHYRYVGETIAKYIHDNDITFEEYYAYFIEK